MIEFSIICPECGKDGDYGKVGLDPKNGKMKVECGWCRTAWILDAPLLSAPIYESRKDYMPHWKQKLLGIV